MPIINWNQDFYSNWLLTNSNSLSAQKWSGGITSGLGALSAIIGGILLSGTGAGASVGLPMLLGGLGAGVGGLLSINNAIQNDRDKQQTPNSFSSLSGGVEINCASNCNGFWFYDYTIKSEFAKMIDNYFDMYGYKVNSVEVPNLHTRTYWNYLKVLDPNVEGAIVPEKDMSKFKTQLQAGITFWHDPTHFRDYSQTNSVIT